MRAPQNIQVFAQARARLAEQLAPHEAFMISAQPLQVRNNDVHHPWRQDSDFFYLTGFEEPGAVYLITAAVAPDKREHILFVQPKNAKIEQWEGFRHGTQGAREHFAFDKVFSLNSLPRLLTPLLSSAHTLHYKLNVDAKVNNHLKSSIHKKFNLKVADNLLASMRVCKQKHEIQMMQKACEISSRAHIELMRHTRPGQNERALHGLFIQSCMSQGAAREAYGSIVASGNNACTLHYVFNDAVLKKDEMLLVDAGCEYKMYASDITRTYPITGRFKGVQKKLYTALLGVQKGLIQAVRPGVTWAALQNKSVQALVDVMCEFKLLKGSKRKIIDSKAYKQFYPHGVGHWLGLDVHDAGGKKNRTKNLSFCPGMCLTIEPGIYIPDHTPGVPDNLRGLGIRIEDDLVVTDKGAQVLTESCPKSVRELEKIIGKA